jgi:hypothetical protein
VNLQFRSVLGPPVSLIEQVAARDPDNPFCTPKYVTASESLGGQACFLGLCDGDEVVSGCIGLVSGTFLRRGLLIHSLPSLPSPEIFWDGLMELCSSLKVWRLQVDSFASPQVEIPKLPGEMTRRDRWEYLLDISSDSFLNGIKKPHRNNITRAIKAGLSLRRTRESSACAVHMELITASMERRAKRGEDVDLHENGARPLALLNSGLGELFQAVEGDRVLSSLLILRSSRGAYGQSAGNSPEGMKVGASHFLWSSTAIALQREGVHVFNLGGTDAENPGLQRFKAGFGAREVALQAASFCPRSAVEREIHGVLRTGWGWIKGQ